MLEHIYALKFAQFLKDSKVEKPKNIYELDRLIQKFVEDFKKKNPDPEDDPSGLVEEVVYGEFLLPRMLPDVKMIHDTSKDKYTRGIDFYTTHTDKIKGVVQVKAHHDPNTKFGVNDNKDQNVVGLGTFMDEAYGLDKNHTILVTPYLEHNPSDNRSIFEESFKAQKGLRVVSKNQIQKHILTGDPTFFDDLFEELFETLDRKITYKKFPKSSWQWNHQTKIVKESKYIWRKKDGRGWVVVSTGGGKSIPMYKNILYGYEIGKNVQAVVAPKLALLQQHLTEMELHGFFNEHGIIPVAFHSEDMGLLDNNLKMFRTLNPEDLRQFLMDNKGEKILVFTTYVSDEKFLNGNFEDLDDQEIEINPDENIQEVSQFFDGIHFDEFHHLATQSEANMNYISSLPGNVFFYSASVVRGVLFSTVDEKFINGKPAFGKKIINVNIRELQEKGIIVPKFSLHFVKAHEAKIRGIKTVLKDQAKLEGFDLEKACQEIACVINSANFTYEREGCCKLLLYTKYSKYIKLFQDNWSELKTLLNFDAENMLVLADTDKRNRKNAMELVHKSENCIFLNHSVMAEGIDIEGFNNICFGRSPELILLQQGMGRGARTLQEDKEKFRKKILKYDDSDLNKKMKKPCCHVTFILHGDNVDKENETKNIVEKLILNGWDENDILIALDSERTKKKHTDSPESIEMKKIEISANVIKKAMIKIKQKDFDIEVNQYANSLENAPLTSLFN